MSSSATPLPCCHLATATLRHIAATLLGSISSMWALLPSSLLGPYGEWVPHVRSESGPCLCPLLNAMPRRCSILATSVYVHMWHPRRRFRARHIAATLRHLSRPRGVLIAQTLNQSRMDMVHVNQAYAKPTPHVSALFYRPNLPYTLNPRLWTWSMDQ